MKNHHYLNQHIVITIVSFLTCFCAPAQNAGKLVTAEHGMVVSASAEASRVGLDILRNGGNAVDAAVATGFALAVTYPSAGNLGGGSYIVIRMADGRTAAIDARETAPAAATGEMYLDENGSVVAGLSLEGPLSSGVPGTVDGLLRALDDYGSIQRQSAIAPAISLAREGFPLHPRAANLFRIYHDELSEYPSTSRVFYKQDGAFYSDEELFKQPDLAETLERISEQGRTGFYTGETAKLIVRQMQEGGGLITRDDLEDYISIKREPVSGVYKGYEILSMPPSSSGGVVLLETLNILAHVPLGKYERTSYECIHVMAEAMKHAFADRAYFLGDPEYTDMPLERLLSDSYASKIADRISLGKAIPSDDIGPGINPGHEGMHTTHYSIVDRWGNAVSVTTTLNSSFGSKCVVDGAGFLLNNEMDDFSIKPGAPNQFGLIGNEANAIEPGKRMLSSMTPVIVARDGAPVLVVGSPGGSTIITTVLQVVLNILEHELPVDESVRLPRFHHQWKPDEIIYEEGALTAGVRNRLREAGHRLRRVPAFGRAEAIYIHNSELYGCSDPRGYGAALGY